LDQDEEPGSTRSEAGGGGGLVTRCTFFGRILPERNPLRVEPALGFTAQSEEIGFRYRATIQIADGQFVVPVVVEDGPDDVHTLRNLVKGDVGKVADYIGYLSGFSFDVDIISPSCDDGRAVVFGTGIPVLQETRQGKHRTVESDRLNSVIADIPSQMVLADFREAIRNAIGTGFFCYRAIEAMMQSVKTTASDKDSCAWDSLRAALRLDRSAIDAIKAHGDFPRHGRISSISDADRIKVFRLTDEIIRRYLEYVHRGFSASRYRGVSCVDEPVDRHAPMQSGGKMFVIVENSSARSVHPRVGTTTQEMIRDGS
jgi:hypothetical protein